MLNKTLKRFYKQADAAETDAGFAIRLDGRPVKTPMGKALAVPTLPLAQAIATEWHEQGEDVIPASMPLTQLASTAIDRIGPERATITEQLMKYAGTDLLCYRTDFPLDLAERQTRDWQPVLDWAADTLGARMATTCGIIAIEQPPHAMAALRAHLDAMDVWRLTVTQAAAAAAGSLVLAVAMAEGRLSGAETFALSQLDETFQIEQWGEDEEAAERRAALHRDMLSAENLLRLLR